jgi:hypothetical protein
MLPDLDRYSAEEAALYVEAAIYSLLTSSRHGPAAGADAIRQAAEHAAETFSRDSRIASALRRLAGAARGVWNIELARLSGRIPDAPRSRRADTSHRRSRR